MSIFGKKEAAARTLLAIAVGLSGSIPVARAAQITEGGLDCSKLVSVRTDLNIYWNSRTESYSNIPWFKDERDNEPSNRNPSIQSENRLRAKCGLPPLEVVNLSNSNPDVDLNQPVARGSAPVVKGMDFTAFLCTPPECYAGTPLYTRKKK